MKRNDIELEVFMLRLNVVDAASGLDPNDATSVASPQIPMPSSADLTGITVGIPSVCAVSSLYFV